MAATLENRDSTSDFNPVLRVCVNVVLFSVAVYVAAFVILVFVPGAGNQLVKMGVKEKQLEALFYPLLQVAGIKP